MKQIAFVLLLFVGWGNALTAQVPAPFRKNPFAPLIPSYDAVSVNLPLLDGPSAKSLLIIGAAAYLISNSDAQIDEEYAREDHKSPLQVLKLFGRIGELYDTGYTFHILGAVTMGAYGYRFLSQNPAPAHTVRLMLTSLGYSSLVTTSLKVLVSRGRPYTGASPLKFDLFDDASLDSRTMSFPSGHTSSIFAMMTVLAKRNHSLWVKVPAYTFASSVAFQRMLNRKHWASDVIVGGLIGYLIGDAVVRKDNRARAGIARVHPSLGRNKAGLEIDF